MFSKLKSVFKGSGNSETSPFQHPKVQGADQSQCPFMKNKKNSSQKSSKCPYNKQTGKENPENKKTDSSDEESEPEEKPKGGCPFMNSSGAKKNPNLGIQHQGGFDEPFVSKYKYYLSDSKINFSEIRRGKKMEPINREKFDQYPIYLKHTLFYNGEDFKKVRGFECCSRFMAYEELRERGNKYFNKGKYAKALEFYQRSMSLFRWLQYEEPTNLDESTDFNISSAPSQTEISEEQSISSKINLNFSQHIEEQMKEPLHSKEFDEFQSKYKEFFVVYSDKNVKYCNGEEMDEKPDIDMRNSLLIQLYLNMAATYINLNHINLAHQVLNDALEISEKVSQVYLRKAQATLCNKGATQEDLRLAQLHIQRAIQMRPNEKIFQNTNPNILKMVNIHDAEQVYNFVAQKVSQRIEQVYQKTQQRREEIEKRLMRIKQIEKQIISQGKTPQQGSPVDLLSNSQDFKILSRIYVKYIRIIDFFNETKDKSQLILAKKQFQQVLRVINQIEYIQSIQINSTNPEFGDDEIKIQGRTNRIKRQICDDLYNSGRFNFQVLQWAIKEIVDEEHEERKRKEAEEKKRKQEEDALNGIVPEPVKKSNLLDKLPYAAFVLPVVGLAINYLIF